MKTVWIVNYYTKPPYAVSNPRHLEFARYFVNCGYKVRIFSSDLLRKNDKCLVPEGQTFVNKVYEGLDYTHIACMSYVGNGVKRGLSIFQFAWRLFLLRGKFEKPDVILHNVHAPFDYPIVWCAKRLNAKYIAEVWDLWPDQFVRFGLMKAGTPIADFFYWIEKKIYEKADGIVFSMEGGLDYLKDQGYLVEQGGNIDKKKVFYINSGVNLEKFENNRKRYPTHDIDLLDDSFIKVVYLGSIRLVNKVKNLIDAAELLKDNTNIKFIIIGDGTDRAYLEKYCNEKNIKNVLFKQRYIPFAEVPDVVSHASINIMNYQNNFGLYGVSSGKLFVYLAAGNPICCNVSLNYCEITKNDIGIAANLDTPQKYADAILRLASLSQRELSAMKIRIRRTAEKFDYNKLSQNMIEVIESLF